MVLTSLADLSEGQKEELVASLSCLVAEGELTAEKITEIASASGNSVSTAMASLFASVVAKAPKGIEQFTPPPGGGGGGGGGGGAAAGGAAAEAQEEEKEEEEEEADLGGGMDMFGGGDDGGDY
eukprot:Nitzschia sp. Nitz4//NODE_389_length_21930_cov_67.393920//21172//21702//NITZ4_additional_000055-RA//1//CDS//3329531889//2532//frame0